uniref:PAS domain-containing hybrid sensor histidine kinase/response regulator n=1 Tax=uncultured Phenylobacterium sp. TaxID=349273 RepID=UPI0025DC3AAA
TRDVTDRVERDHRFHLIAENTSDIIVTRSLSGRASFVSASCEAITGWTPAEFAGRRYDDLIHPEDQEKVWAVYARVIEGAEGASVRWRGQRKGSGEWIWFESRPSLLQEIRPGGEPELIDVIRDVTAQVAQETALAHATEAAQAAAKAKADFLANMSHEIRTPLTAVLGFAGILTARDDLAPEARHLADRIARAGRGLLTIVNDVLDFSKLEAGRFEIQPRPSPPLDLVQDVVAMFRTLADEKGLDLSVETDMSQDDVVSLDPERTRQVLVNLVGNALKFTDEGGVTIRLAAQGDRLGFEVVDTGPGLTSDQCDKLFQRFSQVDNSSTRRHGGTGLGLAICRGLVEAMDGEIGVRSTLGSGSCFHFEIAAPAATAAAAIAESASSAGSLDGVRLLVADDNNVNRELVKMVLTPFGVEVTEARDGVEAVERAALLPFDLVLMDIRMPRLDGFGALAQIRAGSGPNTGTPIIAFSAGTEITPDEAHGFDGFIPKPIEVPILVGSIAAMIAEAPSRSHAVRA